MNRTSIPKAPAVRIRDSLLTLVLVGCAACMSCSNDDDDNNVTVADTAIGEDTSPTSDSGGMDAGTDVSPSDLGQTSPDADVAIEDMMASGQFGLSIPAPYLRVTQGSTASFLVSASRSAGELGEISLFVEGLPAGVTVEPGVIPTGADETSLTVRALGTVPHSGPHSVTIRGVAADGEVQSEVTARLFIAGEPGQLDESFSFDGQALISLGRDGHTLEDSYVDADGRIIVAGRFRDDGGDIRGAAIRLAVDGRFDEQFGTQGALLEWPGIDGSGVLAVSARAAGGMYAVGNATEGLTETFYLRAFNDRGEVDGSFGTNGDTLLAPNIVTNASIWERSDSVLVAVYQTPQAFDLNGVAIPYSAPTPLPLTRIASTDAAGRLMLISQPDGAGDFKVGRLQPDGAVDTTFGTDGIATVNVPDAWSFYPLLPTDGGYVGRLTTRASGGTVDEFALVALDDAGDLQAGFGTNGIQSVPRVGYSYGFATQPDGKLLMTYDGPPASVSRRTLLLRFMSDGTPDPGFGSGGEIELPDNLTQAVLYDASAHRAVILSGSALGFVIVRIWL